MSFVPVCRLVDVPRGTALGVSIEGEPVAIVHSDSGEVFAIEDICSHGQVALSEGEIDGCTLECWLHGSRFDLRTGKALGPPATDPVPVFAARLAGEGEATTVLVDISTPAG
jgi:3-phenylpropionate/trans-cinnamate dioxygenase ferredoxin subunit